MSELVPRVAALMRLAKRYDIGFAIDAEEADRLELSLDVLAAVSGDPTLADWEGLGFVVQAYQKRARPVIDWIVALARERRRRIMLRLVKGAYWDSEIKRAQVGGMAGYPVFTRKVHTDVAYLACAKAMLAAPDALYSQFATHNAFTIAAIRALAGDARFEFQCLHGMGESIYDQLATGGKLDRPCRIYAPVGSHETLLAYLVRRLLENGANSSFVNRIVDPAVPIASLVEDPVSVAEKSGGAPHANLPLPVAMLPGRRNSQGLDLADDVELHALAQALDATPKRFDRSGNAAGAIDVANPADGGDVVGRVAPALPADVGRAMETAVNEGTRWSRTPAIERPACRLRRCNFCRALARRSARRSSPTRALPASSLPVRPRSRD